MSEDNNQKASRKQKIIIGIIIGVIIGVSANIALWAINEAEIQNTEKFLGYDEHGYFCKGINIDRYFPLEDCKKSINDAGKTVGEVESEETN